MNQTASTQFANIPKNADGHFRLCFYAAVYYLLHTIHQLSAANGEDLEKTLGQYPFLGAYLQAMLLFMPENISWGEGLVWWQQSLVQWQKAVDTHLPLAACTGPDQLDALCQTTLILVGLVEEDSRFGTLMAHLQRPLASRRPTLELVTQIIGTESPLQELLQAGLVTVINKELPRAEWQLQVPGPLWNIVRGVDTFPVESSLIRQRWETLPHFSDLFFPDDFLAQLERTPQLVQTGQIRTIMLRGTPGSDRLQVARAIVRALGCNLIQTEGSSSKNTPEQALLGPLCTLTHAIPLFVYDLNPGENVPMPRLPGYDGPRIIAMNLVGGLQQADTETLATLTLPDLPVNHRHQQWQASLAGHKIHNLAEISQRFRLPGGTIRQLAPLAITQAALQEHEAVTLADVQAASRLLNRQTLDSLAAPIPATGSWDDVIVGDGTAAKLEELTLRCRHREQLLDHLPPVFGSAAEPGVRALFTGGSGTGKTLAVRVLAAELGMDLYRVDLAAVVNKYIGETEKNLHRILSYAEELDVLLLLDEGDALLGNRTDVRSANDRYANLETNYLLQRLEHYRGIVVVTTNLGENIDTAFLRRMDIVVDFVPPKAVERFRIWQIHLPTDHMVSPANLESIAQRCQFTGGQIRNAALHATLLAVDEETAVSDDHLNRAIASEYRKAGAISPLPGNGRSTHHNGNVSSFLNTLSR